MAKARMVSQEIAEDTKVGRCSDEAALTYAFTLPFLDRDGLCSGKPSWIAGRALQERPHLQHKAGSYIQEWVTQGLVIRYEGNDGPVLFFPGFRKHNANMPYEKEQRSKFPPPPGYHRDEDDAGVCHGLIPNDPVTAGRLAELFDARSLYHKALTEAAQLKETLAQSLGLEDTPKPDLHKKVATYSRPSPDLLPTYSRPTPDQVDTNRIEVEMNRMEVEVEVENERMNEEPDSFVHSLSTDEQVDFEDCFDLLTSTEVGLDDAKARELAAKYGFEFMLRQVFAWLDNRDRKGTYTSTGALIRRIEGDFSAPALTKKQEQSALFRRFYAISYSTGDYVRLDRDYEEAAP